MTSATKFLVGITLGGAIVDQLTKLWATRSLKPIARYEVVPGYVDLEYSLNPGAAWSFLADLPGGFRRVFFIVATIAAMVLIVHIYRKADPAHRALRWALALLLAGAVGNLVDRVRQGLVIDFIVLHVRDEFRWATFNVADVWITAGLLLLLWDMMTRRDKAKQKAKQKATQAPSRPGRRRRRR